MARFGGNISGQLRAPLSPFVERELTANPMQGVKSEFPTPKVPKMKMPGRPRGQAKGNPFKPNPFYGE
jgi:hypothetical protein